MVSHIWDSTKKKRNVITSIDEMTCKRRHEHAHQVAKLSYKLEISYVRIAQGMFDLFHNNDRNVDSRAIRNLNNNRMHHSRSYERRHIHPIECIAYYPATPKTSTLHRCHTQTHRYTDKRVSQLKSLLHSEFPHILFTRATLGIASVAAAEGPPTPWRDMHAKARGASGTKHSHVISAFRKMLTLCYAL